MASASAIQLLQGFLVNENDKTSKQEFLKRIASFSLSTWRGKPEEISPLQCARYGWYNCNDDLLKCSSCKAIVYGKLPERFLNVEHHKIAVEKLKNELINAHHMLCPWQNNPSSEAYYNISRWNKEEIKKQFLIYLNELESVKEILPVLQDSYVNEIEDVLETLQKLCEDHKVTLPLVQLAIRGWGCGANSDVSCPTIHCAYCIRNIGLWNYESESVCENPTKKRKFNGDTIEKKKPLNPIQEHQPWCPWISISEGTDQFGWKFFLAALTNKSNKAENNNSEQNSRQLGQLRKLLSL